MKSFFIFLLAFSISGFANSYNYPPTITYYGFYGPFGANNQPSPASVCPVVTSEIHSSNYIFSYSSINLGTIFGSCMAPMPPPYNMTGFPVYANFTCPFGGDPYNYGSGNFACYGVSSCPTGYVATSSGTCAKILNPIKNIGQPTELCKGNPINIGTGNKFQSEIDYKGSGDFPLEFTRTYNSDPSAVSISMGAGSGWRHSYDRAIISAVNSSLAVAYRTDGKAYNFNLNGANWLPDADVNLQLAATANGGWQLTLEDGSVEAYNSNGQLLSIKSRAGATQTLVYTNGLLTAVTHSNGRVLTLSYGGGNRLTTLVNPAGGQYSYGYDSNGNLMSVTYPDKSSRVYKYNESGDVAAGVTQTNLLTGQVDENGNRYATWTYDSQGRAISSQHAGGAEAVSINYGTNSATDTDALNTTRVTNLTSVQGVVKSAGSNQPAGSGCAAAASNITYDANGNTASRTDFNGNTSCYAYDPTRNLELYRLEGLAPGKSCPANLASYTPAANSSERVIATQWHPSFRLPTLVTQYGQTLAFSYDANGNLLSKTLTDTASAATPKPSRAWTYTYNSLGQVLTADGPRTDVKDITTYAYYSASSAAAAGATHQPGDLQSVTNALGHVTTFTSYDANGRLLSLTDPNGLVINLSYDPRGRLTQKTVGGNTTAYVYDSVGNLLKITPPTGAAISYTYDAAHRLTGISDALGGSIHYTLDAMGNRIQETVQNAAGTLVKTHSRVFDALSRLQQDTGAYNQTVG